MKVILDDNNSLLITPETDFEQEFLVGKFDPELVAFKKFGCTLSNEDFIGIQVQSKGCEK